MQIADTPGTVLRSEQERQRVVTAEMQIQQGVQQLVEGTLSLLGIHAAPYRYLRRAEDEIRCRRAAAA